MKKIGVISYVLELLKDLVISPILNVEDEDMTFFHKHHGNEYYEEQAIKLSTIPELRNRRP